MKSSKTNAKENRTVRCYGYLRVSTLRQADLEHGSLDAQADEIKHYLKFRETPQTQFHLEELLREEGRSGKDTDRPQLKKLLEAVRRGDVDAVVVTKIDRLTRSVRDFYELWGEFEEHGVQLISVRDQFDTTTPMGKAMVNMILTFAQLEREMTAERTRHKMLWHAEQGLWNGGRPPGYRLDPKQKGMLFPHPEERKLVELIFKKYLELGSAGEVAKYLVRQGIKTPTHTSRRGRPVGGKTFYKTTILRILRNPVYIGKVRYNGSIYDGKHEPIIPVDLFNEVNEHLKEHAPRRRNPREPREHAYLLQGLLFCGRCGGHMTPKTCSPWKQNYFYYQCSRNGHTNGTACSMRYAPAPALERAIVAKILEIALNSEELERIIRDANANSNESLKRLGEDRHRAELRLQTVIAETRKIVEVIKEMGKQALKTVGGELRKLEAERTALEAQIEEIRSEEALVESQAMDAGVMAGSLRTFADIVTRATPQELKDLLPMFVERIVFHEPDDKGRGVIRMSLFERPVRRGAGGRNHHGAFCAESSDWLPGQDSNLQPCGYEGPALSDGLGLSLRPCPPQPGGRAEGVGRFPAPGPPTEAPGTGTAFRPSLCTFPGAALRSFAQGCHAPHGV